MSEPGGDPFLHHPALRGRIVDPSTSFFRSFRPADLDARMAELGRPADWRFSDEALEAARQAFLAGRRDRDLWVFAYGSLMWDPAIRFAEVRRARVAGYARRFILKDTFGAAAPRRRPACRRRSMSAAAATGSPSASPGTRSRRRPATSGAASSSRPVYRPVVVAAATAAGPIEALAVVADHAAAFIRPDLTRAEQVRYLATGAGMLGTSLAYIENLAAQFAALGIDDPEVASLLAEARAYAGTG